MPQAPSLPPLPNVYECRAEPDWRAIDFISDLHLAENTPRTVDVWAQYLRETPADAVFILGDLFEVWVGDDAREEGGFPLLAANVLQDASGRRAIGFMVGNRDFLVGAAMLRECGVAALSDPTVLDAWGQRILLTHGDALCLADTAYQAYRAQVRTPKWRREVLAKPLAERQQLARTMRDASETVKRGRTAADWADVDAAAAVAWMHAAGSRTMVHGHTHRPGSDVLAPGHVRWVLSDWDCDHPPYRAQALRLTRDGLARVDLLRPA